MSRPWPSRIDGGGRTLGYSADTGPGWSLAELGTGLDLVLCEATYTVDHEGTAAPHERTPGRRAGRDGPVPGGWSSPTVADGRAHRRSWREAETRLREPGGTSSDRKGIRTVSEGTIARRTDRAR